MQLLCRPPPFLAQIPPTNAIPGTPTTQTHHRRRYLFLAHQNRIATTLKSKLHPSPQEPGIPGFEAAIQEMLEFAATQVTHTCVAATGAA